MKKSVMILAMLALLMAGCQTTSGGGSAEVDETPREQPVDNGQDAKDVVFVLGVNGMD